MRKLISKVRVGLLVTKTGVFGKMNALFGNAFSYCVIQKGI